MKYGALGFRDAGISSVADRSVEFNRTWFEPEPRPPRAPKPVVDKHILIVALLIRTKASLHASAGGHFSIKSSSTDVAASTVKSTSSRLN